MFKAPPAKPQTPLAAPQPVHATPDSTMSSPAGNPFANAAGSLDPDAKAGSGRKHQRIPSVVLSPSPSNETPGSPGEKPREIVLDLDDVDRVVPLSPVLRDELAISSTYHTTLSKPEFWEGLLVFLRYVVQFQSFNSMKQLLMPGTRRSQFQSESDVHLAFEDFLRASKGALTVSDIAKIRDHTGIIGMAGT